MPNWFPSYTNCSSASAWYAQPLLTSAAIAGLSALLGGGLVNIGAWGPGAALASAGFCIAGIYFCNWWLNIRLICLGGDRGVIGVMYAVDSWNTALWLPNPMAYLNDFDTDWCFNLLIWPFNLTDQLPNSPVGSSAAGTIFPYFTTPGQAWSIPDPASHLISNWPATYPPFSGDVTEPRVLSQLELILPQPGAMGTRELGYTGQGVTSNEKTLYKDPPNAPSNDPPQHFLLHCEVEGKGMLNVRTFLWGLFTAFMAAAALEFIPGVGIVIWAILMILAWFLALFGMPNLQQQVSQPTDTVGGSINAYVPGDPNNMVDILYVFGRWVFDSNHQPSGSNELHPVHFIINIESATQSDIVSGNWPSNLGSKLDKYNGQYEMINQPMAAEIQALPENQWSWHPLLDGCEGATPYPYPPPPPPGPLK